MDKTAAIDEGGSIPNMSSSITPSIAIDNKIKFASMAPITDTNQAMSFSPIVNSELEITYSKSQASNNDGMDANTEKTKMKKNPASQTSASDRPTNTK